MSDILIVHQLENMIINVFGMHFDFTVLTLRSAQLKFRNRVCMCCTVTSTYQTQHPAGLNSPTLRDVAHHAKQ